MEEEQEHKRGEDGAENERFHQNLLKSRGGLVKIFEFLDWKDQLRAQLVCRKFYDEIVPMSTFQMEYYPKISMYNMIIELCRNFSKGMADSVDRILRSANDRPFDHKQWPQFKTGTLRMKTETTLSYDLDMWTKEGSVRGYGRKKLYEVSNGERGPHIYTRYGWKTRSGTHQYPQLAHVDKHQIVIDPYETEERDLKKCS